MTRIKKSRKVGKIGIRKQDARPAKESSERRKKAPKGQKSGSRNSLIEPKVVAAVSSEQTPSDPRKGSKKQIALQARGVDVKAGSDHNHEQQAQVVLKKVKVSLTPQQELDQIETDERLIALAERVEDGELLTGKDAKYFNRLMDRHAELIEELGIELDEEDDEIDSVTKQFGADQWDDLLKDSKE